MRKQVDRWKVVGLAVALWATACRQVTFGNQIPVPQIAELIPSSIVAGGGEFTLEVRGANFLTNSVVLWDAGLTATTFVSATRLTAVIPAEETEMPGTVQVIVRTTVQGTDLFTQPLTFTIEAPPAPADGRPVTGGGT